MTKLQRIWHQHRLVLCLFTMIATPIFSGGVTWAVFSSLPSRVEALEKSENGKVDRLARMETKIDILMQKFNLQFREQHDQ